MQQLPTRDAAETKVGGKVANPEVRVMGERVRIGLVGNYSETVQAHEAIPLALGLAAAALDREVAHVWVPTEEIESVNRIAEFDALWCVPGSPYRSMEGALLAIRHAREQAVPFLGTCGGFQHAIIEYARNVLGWSDAEHGESSPDASRAVISPLSCGLLDDYGTVLLQPGSRIAAAYGTASAAEQYLCRYGVNPQFRSALVSGPLHEVATDEAGDLRAVELDGHPFFVASLFQPERAALRGTLPPLVVAFVRAAVR
jgi:CTP synthase (UTP-ammonia lyase)